MRMAAIWLTAFTTAPLWADDTAAILAKQKQTIESNWKLLQLSEAKPVESANFLIIGSLAESKLKALSATLEKQYAVATQALKFDGDKPITGKMAVYVIDDGTKYRSFVRTVLKATPDDEEQGRQSVKGDLPFVAAGPGRNKDSLSPDAYASTQVAVALLAARTKNAPLPEWATIGFAKATAFQASGVLGVARKRAAREVARRARVSDLWGETLSSEQKIALGTSVMDFLVYGKGVAKPLDVISAMRPEEDKPVKMAADVFGAVNMTPEQFEAAFAKWLLRN